MSAAAWSPESVAAGAIDKTLTEMEAARRRQLGTVAANYGITNPAELDELLCLLSDLILEPDPKYGRGKRNPDFAADVEPRHARLAHQAMLAGLIDESDFRELCPDGGRQSCACDGEMRCFNGCRRGYFPCGCEVCSRLPEPEVEP